MDSGLETVQDANLETLLQKTIDQMRPNKTCAASYQNSHSQSPPHGNLVYVTFSKKPDNRYYLPDPANTSPRVLKRIHKSSFGLHRRMYSRSSLTQSSKSLTSFLPLICHKQVIPGLI